MTKLGKINRRSEEAIEAGQGGPVAEAVSPDAGWQRVRYTLECDPDGDGWCGIRNTDPSECDCIGPTQEGVEYREIDGELWGRKERVPTSGFDEVERDACPSCDGRASISAGQSDGR